MKIYDDDDDDDDDDDKHIYTIKAALDSQVICNL